MAKAKSTTRTLASVPKKTRQGKSKRTKYGTKISKKYYKKKYRGQG